MPGLGFISRISIDDHDGWADATERLRSEARAADLDLRFYDTIEYGSLTCRSYLTEDESVGLQLSEVWNPGVRMVEVVATPDRSAELEALTRLARIAFDAWTWPDVCAAWDDEPLPTTLYAIAITGAGTQEAERYLRSGLTHADPAIRATAVLATGTADFRSLYGEIGARAAIESDPMVLEHIASLFGGLVRIATEDHVPPSPSPELDGLDALERALEEAER